MRKLSISPLVPPLPSSFFALAPSKCLSCRARDTNWSQTRRSCECHCKKITKARHERRNAARPIDQGKLSFFKLFFRLFYRTPFPYLYPYPCPSSDPSSHLPPALTLIHIGARCSLLLFKERPGRPEQTRPPPRCPHPCELLGWEGRLLQGEFNQAHVDGPSLTPSALWGEFQWPYHLCQAGEYSNLLVLSSFRF